MLGIYGAGGLGRELYDLATRINSVSKRWASIVFIDDNASQERGQGLPTISLNDFLERELTKEVVIGVGEPRTREHLTNRVKGRGIRLATLIDPTAIVSESASLSEGVVVSEFCSVHSMVTIGESSLVQPFCCVGHDIKIGSNSVISTTANIGGGSTIGDRVYLGMNCAIMQKTVVEDDAVIGMGAVVFRHVAAGCTVIGNPARVTKGNGEGRVFL